MPDSSLSDERGFVLLHGAMLGRWIWDRVVPLLDGPALAVDLPGRGDRPADLRQVTLNGAVDAVAGDIEAFPAGRVVLVAHSLSGILAPGLMTRLPGRLAQVVFVSAAIPRSHQSFLDVQPLFERLFFRLVLLIQRKGPLTPAWAARQALCNDLDEPTARLVVERLTREAPRLYSDRVSGEIGAGFPTMYIRLTRDRAVSMRQQNESIARLPNPRVEELDTGHLPMLGQPDRLAAILNVIGR